MSDDIGKIIKEQKKTAILVTHDISEAISMGDCVVILSHRPAHIKKLLISTFPFLTGHHLLQDRLLNLQDILMKYGRIYNE